MDSHSPYRQTTEKILAFLKKRNQYLVSAHLNADGDAIASVISMGMLLEKLGKKYYMVLHDAQIDSRFSYLKNFENIYTYDSSLHFPIEAAIILDVPGLNRLGKVTKMLPDRSSIIRIDHHPTEDDFAQLNLVDEKASSATQLVYALIEAADIATKQFGVGPGAVRFIDGTFSHHVALEERIAYFVDKPAAKIFNSAYTSNCGLAIAISTKQTYWVGDELNHNSIIRAMRIANVPKQNKASMAFLLTTRLFCLLSSDSISRRISSLFISSPFLRITLKLSRKNHRFLSAAVSC